MCRAELRSSSSRHLPREIIPCAKTISGGSSRRSRDVERVLYDRGRLGRRFFDRLILAASAALSVQALVFLTLAPAEISAEAYVT